MATKNKIQVDLTAFDRTKAAFRSVNNSIATTKKSVSGLSIAFQAMTAAFAVGKVVTVVRGFETLTASLITVTGSAENAKDAMAGITVLAQQLPFSIQEVTDSFIKLKAYGLDPSEEALLAYGNTAAAMGKSLNQAVEAVADAAVGEFERLKEFGIKAKSQGDRVIFTFRGVATEVGKNAQEIEDYIKNIGLEEFAGAAALQIDTLGGAMTNLADSIALAVNQLATESGFVQLLKDTALAIDDIIKYAITAEDPLSRTGKILGELAERREALRKSLSNEGDQDEWQRQYEELKLLNQEIDSYQAAFNALASADRGTTPLAEIGETVTPDRQSDKTEKRKKEIKDEMDFQLDAIDAVFRAMEEEYLLQEIGLKLTKEQTEALQEQERIRLKAIDDQNAAGDAMREAMKEQKRFADDVAATMTSAFEDAIFQAGNLKDIFTALLEDLAKMVVRMAILRPAANSISGFIPAFASGTSYAPGGVALVGEAGPELVNLPRGSSVTPNNKLGGSTYVTVNNNTNSEATVSETSRGDDRMIEIMIENTVSDSISNNGGVGRAMTGTFASNRQVVQR